ncbi:GPI mannosyltransferase 2 [Bienertia sinuspersici]
MSGTSNVPAIFFALSGSARSNGVLNAGYYGFKALHQSYDAVYVKKRALILSVGALRCICIFFPFLAFQAYGYYNICYGRNPDEMRPLVQKEDSVVVWFYPKSLLGCWLLKYFQLKQLPNFLLASPVLSLAFCSIFSYLKADPKSFFSLGFGTTLKKNSSAALFFSGGKEQVRDDHHYAAKQEVVNMRQRQKSMTQERSVSPCENQGKAKSGYYSVILLPFIYHLSFMAATAFFVMHVQVATRFLSASPPLYWFASYLMTSAGQSRIWAHLIWAYAASYILLGSLLFSNFYPFT